MNPVNGHCLFSNLLFSGTTHQHWPTVSQPGGTQFAEYKCSISQDIAFTKLPHNILHRTLAWKKAFCLLNSGLGSGLSIKFKVIGCDNINWILTSTFAGLECLRNTDGLGTCSILVIMVARTALWERSPGAQLNFVPYTRCWEVQLKQQRSATLPQQILFWQSKLWCVKARVLWQWPWNTQIFKNSNIRSSWDVMEDVKWKVSTQKTQVLPQCN